MKKILYTLVLSTTLWSCGGSGGETPTPPPEPVNNAPTVPTLVSPTNNLLCLDNFLNFEWKGRVYERVFLLFLVIPKNLLLSIHKAHGFF